jgi:hypothetical protein
VTLLMLVKFLFQLRKTDANKAVAAIVMQVHSNLNFYVAI